MSWRITGLFCCRCNRRPVSEAGHCRPCLISTGLNAEEAEIAWLETILDQPEPRKEPS